MYADVKLRLPRLLLWVGFSPQRRHLTMQTLAQGSTPDALEGQVIISRPEAFLAKKSRFIAEGSKKLQVVADFDFTLTRFWVNGERASSCHKTIEDCALLPDEYHEFAQGLQKHYYPLEVDHTITLEQKIVYMEEWVTKAHDALIQYRFRKELLEKVVRSSNLTLRGRIAEVFDTLEQRQIPLLLFSAGIANVIEEALRQQARMPSTCHIVSNEMIFDDEGHLTGFTEPVFHVLNKRAASVVNVSPYFHQPDYESRRNVLLLGDNTGDLHMSDGISFDEIITVGYLNDRVEQRLEEYKSRFDVVILGDPDLTFIRQLLDEIR